MDRRKSTDYSTTPSSRGGPVLDVKPLRSLAPMYPANLGTATSSHPNAPTFVCISPFAPSGSQPGQSKDGFSNGMTFSHIFQTPPSMAQPLNQDSGLCDDKTTTGSRGRKKSAASFEEGGSKKKKNKHRKKISRAQDMFLLPSSEDPREAEEVVLMTYDALRRRLMQIDEANNQNKSAHLRAGTIMMDNNLRVNVNKTVGPVPGVEVGDIFYFRIEICLVGLHVQSMSGIDYMNTKFDNENDTLALSIVSSGGYDNDTEDPDVLIYSGQGGTKVNDGKTQSDDQKLERGNLALERSLHRGNQIRVIRGTKDIFMQYGKLYYYDGLYKIHESWIEKGKSGFNVFKYKLLREPDQRDGFALWKRTEKWRANPSSRESLILSDISIGAESIPVCVVNEVDLEKGTDTFIYSTKLENMNNISSVKLLQGCSCLNSCAPDNPSCNCFQQNGGDTPYTSNGLLVRRKPMIYECNSVCRCVISCRNRVTQKGIKLRLEVFRTTNRGWGLRSWDPIRAGTFICEYTGEVIDKIAYDDSDDYIFETNSGNASFKWNYGPELVGEPSADESWDSLGASPIYISAKRTGNVSRFMNHSCSPNVLWQLVQHGHGEKGYPHVMLFAMKHIPPMTELTYDYGQSMSGRKPKRCSCESRKCRVFFG